MLEKDKKIITDAIEGLFSLRERFSDFEVTSNFQLLISQLDLFKLLASLVVGVIGIGYIFSPSLDKDFLLISLFFALVTLVFSISYTREIIDQQHRKNKEMHLKIKKETETGIEMAIRALREKDSSIFFNYAKEKSSKELPNSPPNWMGEILVFLFYLSVSFLVFSFISSKFPIAILSFPTLTLLLVVCLISFKGWAIWISERISSYLNKLSKYALFSLWKRKRKI